MEVMARDMASAWARIEAGAFDARPLTGPLAARTRRLEPNTRYVSGRALERSSQHAPRNSIPPPGGRWDESSRHPSGQLALMAGINQQVTGL